MIKICQSWGDKGFIQYRYYHDDAPRVNLPDVATGQLVRFYKIDQVYKNGDNGGRWIENPYD